jgi:alkylation response protein AidB-like acyl-CoA dehydrogenase
VDLSFSDDQRLLKDSVERFIAQRYDFAAAAAEIATSSDRFSPEVWRALAEFGWLGLPLPEADGGFGGSAVDVGIVMEGLGKGLVLEPYVSTVVLGGGPDCRRRLGRAARTVAAPGSPPVICAWRWPHGETMFASLGGVPGTRATRSGDRWTLQGSKCLVLDAPGAHGVHRHRHGR